VSSDAPWDNIRLIATNNVLAAVANSVKTSMAPLRAIQHLDMHGNPIGM